MAFEALTLDRYAGLSAKKMGRLLAERRHSPVQLVECALHLAKAGESSLNAYVSLLPLYAAKIAATREREIRHNRSRGPLHGVPIAIKDNFYLSGFPVTRGSRTKADYIASHDSPMIERAYDAGMVFIGKTTMPEFGWKGTGSSPLTGITRNPWDTRLNPGGSSAGSAATVAARAVPIAFGSDAGGSIRIPAAFCGIVGLKPTLGRIPVWPGTVTATLSHVGPLTRTVEDARLVLSVTRGPDPRDPLSFAAEGASAVASLKRISSGALRVGLVDQPFRIEPETSVAAAFAAAVKRLRRGFKAAYLKTDLLLKLPREIFETLWVTGRGYGFSEAIAKHRSEMDPGLVRCGELAAHYTLPDYFKAIEDRRNFVASVCAVFDRFDVLVMPTMPITAFNAEDEVPEGGEASAPLPWITWAPYTYPFNLTGQPAITIPCGLADEMPVGLQIVGPWGHDDLMLAVARRLERALAPQLGNFQPALAVKLLEASAAR